MSRRATPKANAPAAGSVEGAPTSRRAAPKAYAPAAGSAEGTPTSRQASPKADAPAARNTEGDGMSIIDRALVKKGLAADPEHLLQHGEVRKAPEPATAAVPPARDQSNQTGSGPAFCPPGKPGAKRRT